MCVEVTTIKDEVIRRDLCGRCESHRNTSVWMVRVCRYSRLYFRLQVSTINNEVIMPNWHIGPFAVTFWNVSGDNLNNNGPSSKETKVC